MSTSGENLDLNLSLNLPLYRMQLEKQSHSPLPSLGHVSSNPFAFLSPPSTSSAGFTSDKFVANYNGMDAQKSGAPVPKFQLVPQINVVRAFLNCSCYIPFSVFLLCMYGCLPTKKLVSWLCEFAIIFLFFIFNIFYITIFELC